MWKDRWFFGACLIDSFPWMVLDNSKVSDFIQEGKWNEDKLKLFLPSSFCSRIAAIPFGIADTAFWSSDSCQGFSTSSAWSTCRNQMETDSEAKWLWHSSIPIKISMLNWRLINNLLPVDKIMNRFGFHGPSKCLCCHAEESITHVFCRSGIASDVWKRFGMLFDIAEPCSGNPKQNISIWRNSGVSCNKGNIRSVVPLIINWALWEARNDAKHRNIKILATNVITRIENKISSMITAKLISYKNCSKEPIFCSFFKIPLKCSTNPNPRWCRWLKPNFSWIKLNIDGCSKGNPGRAGAGGIFRDWQGNVILSYYIGLGNQNSYMAELLALLEGMKIISKVGFHRVWIEADSLVLVNQINKGFKGTWKTFLLFLVIHHILDGIQWKCTHIWREANAAADYLANMGLVSPSLIMDFSSHFSGPLHGITVLDKMAYPYIRLA